MKYRKFYRKTSLKQNGIGEAFLDDVKKINPKSFSKVYVARGFFEQRYLENGNKVGPGNFDDSNEFKIAAEKEGINFIILDNHFLVSSPYLNVAITLVILERPEINNKKKLITKNPFTNHLAGKPLADVDLSFVFHDNSKKGTA